MTSSSTWRRFPRETLLIGLLLTGGSYFALCLYDFMALRYLHKKVPLGRVVVASFIANAFGHNLGFAAFTGGAFRLRLYASSRLTAIDVATVTGFTSLTTVLGLAVLAGVSFLVYPEQASAALRSHAGWLLLVGPGAAGHRRRLLRLDLLAPRAPGISRLAAAAARCRHRRHPDHRRHASTWAAPAPCCG